MGVSLLLKDLISVFYLVFFAVSKQIPIVYSADRGRAENISFLMFSPNILIDFRKKCIIGFRLFVIISTCVDVIYISCVE